MSFAAFEDCISSAARRRLNWLPVDRFPVDRLATDRFTVPRTTVNRVARRRENWMSIGVALGDARGILVAGADARCSVSAALALSPFGFAICYEHVVAVVVCPTLAVAAAARYVSVTGCACDPENERSKQRHGMPPSKYLWHCDVPPPYLAILPSLGKRRPLWK